jgi:hypothetical protein
VKKHAKALRGKYLAKMEQLFNERQVLNLEAVKVLLPQEVGAGRFMAHVITCSNM